MQLFTHLSLLSLLATATTGLQLLQYDIPAELLELFGPGNPDPVAAALSGSSSSMSTAAAAACYYPATFTLSNFKSWSPTANASLSYVSFQYSDNGTHITTSCAYNATSRSLTAGTGLADRYACDDDVVSFIWQKGKITAIETTCPGQTATKFEASGSVLPTGLKCAQTNGTDAVGLGWGPGTLCVSSRPLSANFTSQQPSPLQD
ncbi:MAG: hypothetical protein STHCBS139747_004588 [Sporothrix thermara]